MQRILHAVLFVPALFIAGVLLPSAPAQAAGYGPGFDVGLGRLGAYVTPLGTQAYCLEIAKDRPLGTTDGGTVGGWGGLGSDALTRLNWVLHEYGQSADPVVTGAVNLYVWSIADPGTYDSHGMSGDEYYSGRAGDARGAVLGMLGEIRARAGSLSAPGSVTVELEPDLTGRITVSDPSARGATVAIQGADVAGPVKVADGEVIHVIAKTAPGVRTATIEAVATFGARTYPAAITVHDSGPDQHLAGPTGDQLRVSARAEVPLEFRPVLASSVADPVIAVGQRAFDRLDISLSTDSPWRHGEVVQARGTLYGPLPAAPVESESPPVGAAIAWTEVVDLKSTGVAASSGVFAPTAPGHYTWVWSIEEQNQPGVSLLPAEYSWSDRYGLAAESFEVVTPLPSTGPKDDPSWWLGATGAVLLGVGLTGIAVCLRIRLQRARPTS